MRSNNFNGVESAGASTTAVMSNVNDVISNIEKLIEKIDFEKDWRRVVSMLGELKEMDAEHGEYTDYIREIECWIADEVRNEFQARVDAEFAEVENIYEYLGLNNYWYFLKAEENSHLADNINVLIHLENIKKIADECIETMSYALECSVGYGDGIGVCFPMSVCENDEDFNNIIMEYRNGIVAQIEQVAGESHAEMWWENREEDNDAIFDPLDDLWEQAEYIINDAAEVSDEWVNTLLNEFSPWDAAKVMADKVVEMSDGMYVDWKIGYYEYQFIREFANAA